MQFALEIHPIVIASPTSPPRTATFKSSFYQGLSQSAADKLRITTDALTSHLMQRGFTLPLKQIQLIFPLGFRLLQSTTLSIPGSHPAREQSNGYLQQLSH